MMTCDFEVEGKPVGKVDRDLKGWEILFRPIRLKRQLIMKN